MRIRNWALGLIATVIGGIAVAQGPALSPSPTAPATVAAGTPTPPVPGGARALDATDLDAWLDGYMPYALHNGDIAGAVVTVVKDGQVIAARGYGYADIASRRPVDPARTLFRPGSVSKLVTWTAVMQQVEAGKIDLDGDINAYLDFRIPPRGGKPVTMRQVMTHTAGFEEAVKDLISYDPKSAMPIDAYLKRWVPRRIFDAGTTPAYSNWATTLAGYVVQRVSGMPFDTYVEQRVFAPLDMRTASFRQPLPRALRPLMATGYPRASEPARPFEMVVPAPAGSLSASGLDMAKFMIAHLQNGRGILQPATAATMHDSPLDRVNPMSLIPPLNRMELGFFETNINGREVIAHLGDTENFHTSLHLFMNEGVGLYVSFNSAGKEGAAHTVRGQLFQDFADRYFPDTVRDGRVDAKTAAEHARMMTGLWQNSRHSESSFVDVLNLFGQSKIAVDDKGALVVPALKGPGGGAQVWDEIAPFVWRDRYGHDRLAAKVIDGKVVRWSYDGFSPFMVFDPVPASRSSAWLLPAIYASMAILAVTVLFWPLAWAARRRYAGTPVATGRSLRAYRATRVMALLDLALLGGWMWFVTAAFGNLDMLSSKSDGLVWFIQIATAIITVGAVGIAGWNLWLTWRDGRGLARRAWAVLVLLATLVILYFAAAFGLMAMTVNY
ncbi:serine hydrolase domain-containing protein [Sphingomonas sp. 1P08PE]|uniref:serine hydrolase domain-containing protein n=1 Tax=Sphingomonas sp. 1P08PE TaxID=554122 RepID=UPI0039A0CFAC